MARRRPRGPDLRRQALAGEPLTVYGDGSQTRSFCYVDDLIRGLVLLATSGSTPVNIGNPDEFTLLELAERHARVRPSSEIVFEALPSTIPRCASPDITRARQVLGWEPEISLEDGLGACSRRSARRFLGLALADPASASSER